MKKARTATLYIVFNYIKIKCLLALTVPNYGEWVAMTGTLRYSRCPATAVMQLSLRWAEVLRSLHLLLIASWPCGITRPRLALTNNSRHVVLCLACFFRLVEFLLILCTAGR